MKQCAHCGEIKPLEEFQKYARNKDGRTSRCKPCKREYDQAYYKSKEGRKEELKSYNDKRVALNRSYVLQYLSEHPCIDCGETDPVVLEFDHRGEKLNNVTMMMKGSLEKLKAEIAKCDIRCANCHRRKTAKDFGFWRLNGL